MSRRAADPGVIRVSVRGAIRTRRPGRVDPAGIAARPWASATDLPDGEEEPSRFLLRVPARAGRPPPSAEAQGAWRTRSCAMRIAVLEARVAALAVITWILLVMPPTCCSAGDGLERRIALVLVLDAPAQRQPAVGHRHIDRVGHVPIGEQRVERRAPDLGLVGVVARVDDEARPRPRARRARTWRGRSPRAAGGGCGLCRGGSPCQRARRSPARRDGRAAARARSALGRPRRLGCRTFGAPLDSWSAEASACPM